MRVLVKIDERRMKAAAGMLNLIGDDDNVCGLVDKAVEKCKDSTIEIDLAELGGEGKQVAICLAMLAIGKMAKAIEESTKEGECRS